jgi:low affinity Fe/Cu permease
VVSVVISAGRRALAALVLVLTGVLAVWVATFKVWDYAISEPGGKATLPSVVVGIARHTPRPDCIAGGPPCVGVSPAWTLPAAIAIAVMGLLVAVVLHRSRRGAAEGRAVDLGRPSTVDL